MASETQAVLTKLLLQNHTSNALLLADNATHNHIPHVSLSIFSSASSINRLYSRQSSSLSNIYSKILISATALSCSADHLRATYDALTPELTPWKTTGYTPIKNDDDLFQRLGGKEHQYAFLEYFERRVQEFDGDWEKLVEWYFPRPADRKSMLGGLVGGFAHPLILLADGIEVRDANVVVEALALTASDWNPLHAVVEAEPRVREGVEKKLPLQILEDIKSDTRFDGLLDKPGMPNTMIVLKNPTARGALLEYLDALDLSVDSSGDVNAVIEPLVDAAVQLLSTVYVHHGPPEEMAKHKFDFYLTHQLTFCRCLQILNSIPSPIATPKLLRAGWLMMVLTYVTQLRPKVKPELLSSTPITKEDSCKTWVRLTAVAIGITKEKSMDPHFVRVIRTLNEFAVIWPKHETSFLQACVRFEAEWDGWTGFGAPDGEALDI